MQDAAAWEWRGAVGTAVLDGGVKNCGRRSNRWKFRKKVEVHWRWGGSMGESKVVGWSGTHPQYLRDGGGVDLPRGKPVAGGKGWWGLG